LVYLSEVAFALKTLGNHFTKNSTNQKKVSTLHLRKKTINQENERRIQRKKYKEQQR